MAVGNMTRDELIARRAAIISVLFEVILLTFSLKCTPCFLFLHDYPLNLGGFIGEKEMERIQRKTFFS